MKVLISYENEVVYDIEALAILTKGIPVERQGYGKDAKYLPKKDVLSFDLIHDKQLVTEEKDTIEILHTKIRTAEEAKSKEWTKAYNAEQENKKLKEEIEALKKLCPHTEGKPADF
jgi:hypothetical protein